MANVRPRPSSGWYRRSTCFRASGIDCEGEPVFTSTVTITAWFTSISCSAFVGNIRFCEVCSDPVDVRAACSEFTDVRITFPRPPRVTIMMLAITRIVVPKAAGQSQDRFRVAGLFSCCDARVRVPASVFFGRFGINSVVEWRRRCHQSSVRWLACHQKRSSFAANPIHRKTGPRTRAR
jgi:hypothetical protein